jgi:hypothetical protein
MATMTFNITAGGDDVRVFKASTSYPPTGTATVESTISAIAASRTLNSGTYSIYNGFLQFDTSALPNSIVVSSATLRLRVSSKSDNDARNFTGEWYDPANWPITESAYTETPSSTAFSTDITAITSSADNDFALTDPDANISRTGYTAFRLHVDGGVPSAQNVVNFIAYEDATLTEARLVVDYEVAANRIRMML